MSFWYRRNFTAILLWPVSLLFCALASLRRFCYRRGLCRQQRFDTPVIIVGNISVGGSGKTPLLILLCQWLQQRGYRPGVVSRGYGGRYREAHALDENDSVADTGDEPMMIFQRTRCPVVVGADRAACVRHLLRHFDVDIVLSDDGMQHYRLGRDMEIAVVDAERGHGNGFCLPAGPLREPVRRLRQCDWVVYNGCRAHDDAQGDTDGEQRLCYDLGFFAVENLLTGERRPLVELARYPVRAVAGIGHPQRFFSLLRQQGLNIETQAFADHHAYSADEMEAWFGQTVIMTEKDAVKCRPLLRQTFEPKGFESLWFLPVEAKPGAALLAAMEQRFPPRNTVAGAEARDA